MVKNLFLVRHAESSEAVAGIKDIERELTAKGYRDAPRLGRYLFELNIHPDAMFSSNAQRARATAELMAEQLKYEIHKIEFSEDLYNASVRTLLRIINEAKDDWHTLIIIAHNPAVSYLAEYLSREAIGNIVPGGVVNLTFEIEGWKEVSEGTGKLLSTIDPENIIF
ncbi:SixA phosphatase family protein [Catalinimonas niigatensis]|uniref:SixA phosphatase family protein n=1 Tax=Catalinimonas niigatensis TaxID=1397264 RepID=UPI002665E99F|nr:histidine phosphatase family protein [Catalinimonas niigatensis]WPP50252.1 histidine phosphatase family protein [Catalinimonas niigatensis]